MHCKIRNLEINFYFQFISQIIEQDLFIVTFYSNRDTINVWCNHEPINYSVGGIWNMYLCHFQNEWVILESGMVILYLPEDLLIYVICRNICRKNCGSLCPAGFLCPEKSMISVYKSCTITDLHLFMIFLSFGLALSCLYTGHICKVPRLITISLNLQYPSTLVGMYGQWMFPSVFYTYYGTMILNFINSTYMT